MDDKRARAGALDFFQLGFDPVFEISAEHGEGVGDLLDAILEALPDAPLTQDAQDAKENAAQAGRITSPSRLRPRMPAEVGIAIVGRPNAGKSSLVNRLLREERMIVSETPGTTRDSVDTVLTWHKRQFRIVDTAGIRRPGRVAASGQVESVSVLLARRSIESADVVVLVVDAAAGATDQDAAIAGEADRPGQGRHRGRQQVGPDEGAGRRLREAFDEQLRRQLKFLDYAPILHVSAATGERAPKLLETSTA